MRRCSIGQLLTVGSWAASGAGGPWLCATALAGGLPLSGAVTGDARKRHAGVCFSGRVASVFSAGGGVARRVVRSLTSPPAHAERNARLTGISFGLSPSVRSVLHPRSPQGEENVRSAADLRAAARSPAAGPAAAARSLAADRPAGARSRLARSPAGTRPHGMALRLAR